MKSRYCVATMMFMVAVTAGCGNGSGETPPGVVDAGLPDVFYEPVVPPEIDGQITINEFMASNALTILDDANAASDWIELYNPTDMEIPLRGYAFTDMLTTPRKAVLTQDIAIPAGGHLLLWLDGKPELGPAHLNMHLATEASDIGFARPDGSFIDRVHYGTQETDFSAAREPDGSDLWKVEWHVSPGTTNVAGAGQPLGLEDIAAAPEQVPAAGDLSEKILGYDEIPQLGLEVSAAAAAALEAMPRVDVPATLIYEGRSYGPVALHVKGQNSFEPFSKKPSLRINVTAYDAHARFFGLKDLTLNNMHSDFSMLHERLSYLVARKVGVPASRANHLMLTVNGKLKGLYINIETVRKQMLSRWFDDDTGTLWGVTDVEFVASDISKFELQLGTDDRSKIEGLVNALTIASPDAAIAAASAYVDLPELLRYWAMCSVVAQFDAFPYSNPGDDYFLYLNPTTGKLSFIPQGMDETFYSADYDVKQVHSILTHKCLDSPACFQAYADAVWSVQAQTEQLGLEAERVRVQAQIAPYVTMDTNKSYTNAEVAAYQDALHWFITERRAHLATMLPPARN